MNVYAAYNEYLRPMTKRVEQALMDIPDLEPELREPYIVAVSGGMRFRPALMYLAFKMCGGLNGEAWLSAAVSMELLHKASLIHDDLVDGDPLRRGRPSFHCVHGSDRAIIMGDLLVALAYKAMNEFGDYVSVEVYREVNKRFTRAHYAMCCGELLELMPCEGIPDTEYARKVLDGKTASLMEQALAIGAVLGGGDNPEVDALGEYGKCIGLVFQTVNDINNLTGSDSYVKGIHLSDLRAGRLGFPMIGLGMHIGQRRLEQLCAKASLGGEATAHVQNELRALISGGPVRQWLDDILGNLADQAYNALSPFSPSQEKEILQLIGREMFASWFWKPTFNDRVIGNEALIP
ncbi:MAG: polyprenyl synthetase family protein [Firmicutes bacterium]|nr:polyprenyl synthetase family protein [Bacillota bacterium]